MVKLLKNTDWDLVIDRTWFYTKLIFSLCLVAFISYKVGQYYPSKKALAQEMNKMEDLYIEKIKVLELKEPEFAFTNDVQFVRAMHKCIDYVNFTLPRDKRIPYEMIIAQAALESGWGESRFAKEANNLFGIRTWSKEVPGLRPLGVKNTTWKVRIFDTKCGSVKEYIRLLNEHPAYKEFRAVRKQYFVKNLDPNPLVLIKNIDKFSTTKDYDVRVSRIINKIRKLESTYASDKSITNNEER